VGFKPTYNAISLDGVQPLAPTLDHVGLLGKDVDIVERVFAAITDNNPAVALAGTLKVGVVTNQFADPIITDGVRAALDGALERIRANADVVEIDGAPLDDILDTIEDIIFFEAWQVHGGRVSTEPSHFGPETLRLLESSAGVNQASYDAAMARRAELLPSTDALYDGVDVLVTPATAYTAPATTPPIDTPEGEQEGRFTGAFNVTGVPAIVIPCGYDEQGLPVGIQLSSPRGSDMQLLAVAKLVEKMLNFENRVTALS
jgi:Asp-tRNA(Asn)/Glu-tRNA(Gln) amidotransferase A subunit family amidase